MPSRELIKHREWRILPQTCLVFRDCSQSPKVTAHPQSRFCQGCVATLTVQGSSPSQHCLFPSQSLSSGVNWILPGLVKVPGNHSCIKFGAAEALQHPPRRLLLVILQSRIRSPGNREGNLCRDGLVFPASCGTGKDRSCLPLPLPSSRSLAAGSTGSRLG